MKIKLTAVLFVRHISAVIVSVTDPSCWDTAASVVTSELVRIACYIATRTPSINGKIRLLYTLFGVLNIDRTLHKRAP